MTFAADKQRKRSMKKLGQTHAVSARLHMAMSFSTKTLGLLPIPSRSLLMHYLMLKYEINEMFVIR